MLHSCLKFNALPSAERIYGEMAKSDVKPDASTVSILVNFCVKSQNYDKGLEFYDIITQRYDIEKTPELTSSVIIIKLEKGEIDQAMNLFRQSGFHSQCGNPIIAYHLKNSNILDAHAVLSMIRNRDAYTYSTFLNYYARNNMFPQAQQMWEQLMNSPSVKPSAVTFNIMINFLCKQGEVEGAIRVFNRMVNEFQLKPSVYTFAPIILEYYLKRKKLMAEFWLFKMISSYGVYPNGYIQKIIIWQYANRRYDWRRLSTELKRRGFSFKLPAPLVL